MKVTEITVHAARVVPHPFVAYSNLKPGISVRAALEDGEDPVAAVKTLQARAESLVEDHCRHMVESLQELERLSRTHEKVRSLQETIRRAQVELDRARESLPALPAIESGHPSPDADAEEEEEDDDDDDDDDEAKDDDDEARY